MIIDSQKAVIFDVQRGSMNDGPGIRTTLFFSSCPLRCQWCHNPESWSSDISEQADLSAPESGSPRNQLVSRKELVDLVLKDKAFYTHSGGGVTLSGGEPMDHFSFIQPLLRELSEKEIHTCVDTSGYSTRDKFGGVLPFTRLFLYDWKITDPEMHKKFTGVDNLRIRENLFFLMEQRAEIILRCPVIPDVNDNKYHFEFIAEISRNTAILGVELLPYHDLYKGKKACNPGKEGVKSFRIPSREEMDQWKDFFIKKDVNLVN